MGIDSVYLVFLTDHNDNSNSVEGIFRSKNAAKDWVVNKAINDCWMFGCGNYELLLECENIWYVLEKRNGVFERSGHMITIAERAVC
jgi:hypothetical protein